MHTNIPSWLCSRTLEWLLWRLRRRLSAWLHWWLWGGDTSRLRRWLSRWLPGRLTVDLKKKWNEMQKLGRGMHLKKTHLHYTYLEGWRDGRLDGCWVGCLDGRLVGWCDGCDVGRLIGWREGCAVGCCVGCLDGCEVGTRVGWCVGCCVGWRVGWLVGWLIGCFVGCVVGCLKKQNNLGKKIKEIKKDVGIHEWRV